MTNVCAIILAAGKGTRMKSDLPKVMHKIGSLPLIRYVIDAVEEAGIEKIIVVAGHKYEMLQSELESRKNIEVVLQPEQLGTGHAVMTAEPYLPETGDVLVLCGDTPLIRGNTISAMLEKHMQANAEATVMTAELDDPTGYGRIVRDQFGNVASIIEERDADDQHKAIREVNSGTYCFSIPALRKVLTRIGQENSQNEYYLTDAIPEIISHRGKVETTLLADSREIQGINDRKQLAEAAVVMRSRVNADHMIQGVTIIDPALTYIDKTAKIGKDTIIYPNAVIEGCSVVGSGCEIRGCTRITDSIIGDEVRIENSVIQNSTIGNNIVIGPFAYLRPGTDLADNVKIGDFVEIKNSVIHEGAKIPHLSYIGDSEVGSKANIGAGTITCNYDGVNKHKTIIGDRAFIGSNTSLVAPVTIGAGAIIGAGSPITKDVPENALGITRANQKVIMDYAKRKTR